jgi:hypothetical protein
MGSLKTVRNLGFVAMLCTIFAAVEARVLAVGMGDAIEEACAGWFDGEGYDCQDCSTGEGFPPDWGAHGSCDFSGIEDEEERLITAGNYCDGMWYACMESCETEYDDYVAAWFEFYMSPSDPCYEAAKDPSNWSTWGQGSCLAGNTSSWECSCDAFFFGEC